MRTLLSIMIIATMAVPMAWAADSPQFRGANRDGKSADTGLLKTWPEGGPAVAWTTTGIGKGYSSASVVGDKIYISGMDAKEQAAIHILDLDGKILKSISFGKETQDQKAQGPRSTPTIDGNRIYTLSSFGDLHCFELPAGKALWAVNVLEAFGGKKIGWDLAESVLIDGNKAIVMSGGPDASLVALDKMTGKTIWTSKGLSDKASHCSADIIEHNGNRILVTETAKLVVGLNPETGALLWTHPHETPYDVHAVTPVYADGMLYYSGGYKSGGGALTLSEDGSSFTQAWLDTETLDIQHHGVVLQDGYLYGTGHGLHKGLACLELKTGKVMWKTREVTQGGIIYADGMLYIYEGPKVGLVRLVKASPKGFELAGTITVSQGTEKHWAHPAIANGRLYVRHGDALVAYKIK
jgi:outer membrane protein assembly factor BamB